ncbi:Hypothetical predicted protein [Mytilus galloprovincialis]|uniref:Uncharacterized protein n=1 Tax=Mytilus galloprovincialis TaxID=29158 RepID=A0A8B6DAS7_MYTGA|nr:Hypothetical predicted protein [Mytilus galloprovincialis]
MGTTPPVKCKHHLCRQWNVPDTGCSHHHSSEELHLELLVSIRLRSKSTDVTSSLFTVRRL